jgi:hypothetical protein
MASDDIATAPPAGWKPKPSDFSDRLRAKFSSAELQAPVRWDTLIDFLGMIFDGNKATVAQLAKLRAQVKTLTEQPTLKYCGVWSPEKVYGTGNFVTDSGSLWHGQRASVGERPGSSDAWMLAVKRGRDAR